MEIMRGRVIYLRQGRLGKGGRVVSGYARKRFVSGYAFRHTAS